MKTPLHFFDLNIIKIFILTIYLTFAASHSEAQVAPLWKVKSSDKLKGRNMASDKDGNIYVVGIRTKSLSDSLRIVTTKFNASGVEQWSREYLLARERGFMIRGIGSPNMAVDQQGNVHIILPTSREVFKDNRVSSESKTELIKYNNEGVLQWVKMVGDVSYYSIDETYSPISIDSNGNIYLVVGTAFAPSGPYKPQNFLVKYDAAGNKLWHAPLGSSGGQGWFYCMGLTLDSLGNAYSFGGGGFSSGKATYFIHDANGLEKANPTFQMPDDPLIKWRDLEISASGEVFVAGSSMSSLTSNASYYLARMDTKGDTVWTKSVKMNTGLSGYIGMRKDHMDNLFIFSRKPNSGPQYTHDLGELTKYDNNGTVKWAKSIIQGRIGSDPHDYDNFQIDKQGDMYVATNDVPKPKIYKYDNDGNFLWSTSTDFVIKRMIFDPADNVIICDANDYEKLNLVKYAPSVTGLNSLENLEGVDIYPNPAESSLTIKLRTPARLTSTIQISNSLGQEMLNKTINGAEFTADISDFPQGIYHVVIKDADRQIVKNIIKK